MPVARLIVSEKAGQWAAAFRRLLLHGALRVHETRSLVECWEELGKSPASFLVLELTEDNVDSLLTRLDDLNRRYPAASAAVVAARRLSRYEWLIREAGAAHVLFSPRRLEPIVTMARRHLDRAPREKMSFRKSVWARLPWASEGSGRK
jgi:hypothetical protein